MQYYRGYPRIQLFEKYKGYRTIREYEADCAEAGHFAERVPFHRENERFFVLRVGQKNPVPGSRYAVEWNLFSENEREWLLNGADLREADGSPAKGAMIGGENVNFLGVLAAYGYFPDDPEQEQNLRDWLKSSDFKAFISQPGKRSWFAQYPRLSAFWTGIREQGREQEYLAEWKYYGE